MRMFVQKITLAALFGSVALMISGCVKEHIEPAYIPNVSTTQNSDGLVTICWQSRKGYNYRLCACEQERVVVNQKVYRGTGQEIVVQFKRDVRKPLPDYSVIPEKLD